MVVGGRTDNDQKIFHRVLACHTHQQATHHLDRQILAQ